MNICIIGLGYVGFPLAQLCASKGHNVSGLDLSKDKIEKIKKGIDPVEGGKFEYKIHAAANDPKFVSSANVIIICVPTPVDHLKMPDLRPVISAATFAAQHIKGKPLVVVESTINPGVMEDVVKPIFDSMKLKLNVDYNLAHCPERINPGDPKWNVSNIPRVVGGFTPSCTSRAHAFYSSIISGNVLQVSSVRVAEATKIVENTFRDINIAYVNELAKSFDKMGIDVVEVIKGASTKPFAFMAHYPSVGVGGHCIPVDPYYLIEEAKAKGFDHKFLKLAREINNSMPAYTVGLLMDALNDCKIALNGTTVGVLGLSYKANVGDLRESPSEEVVKILKSKGAKVVVYDPYIKSDVKSLKEFTSKCKYTVLCTNHDAFKELDLSKFKVFIDGKNMFYGCKIPKGLKYKGVGR